MSTNDFDRVYTRLFGERPPKRFRQAYAAMCEALYYGISRQDQEERQPLNRKGKAPSEHWPLHEWQLLPAKSEVDKALAQIARALSRWERASQAQGRPPSKPTG